MVEERGVLVIARSGWGRILLGVGVQGMAGEVYMGMRRPEEGSETCRGKSGERIQRKAPSDKAR